MKYKEYDIFTTNNLIGDLYDQSRDRFKKLLRSKELGEYWYLIMTIENSSDNSRERKYEVVSQHYKVKNNNNSLILHSENRSYKIFPEIKITYNGKIKPNSKGFDFKDYSLIGLLPTNGFGTSVYMIFYILEDDTINLLIGSEKYSELRSLNDKNITINSNDKEIGRINFNKQDLNKNIYQFFLEDIKEMTQNHDNLYFDRIRLPKESFNMNKYLKNSINMPLDRSEEVSLVRPFEIYSTEKSINSYKTI